MFITIISNNLLNMITKRRRERKYTDTGRIGKLIVMIATDDIDCDDDDNDDVTHIKIYFIFN